MHQMIMVHFKAKTIYVVVNHRLLYANLPRQIIIIRKANNIFKTMGITVIFLIDGVNKDSQSDNCYS